MTWALPQNDISFASDSNHNYFAFEQSGELWSYDAQSGKMAQIFTFRQKGDSDYRDIYGEHGIRVLRVSESGNVYFIVAGYMNRGRHEGESRRGAVLLRCRFRNSGGKAVCGY